MSTPQRIPESYMPRNILRSSRRPVDDIGFTGSPATALARGDIDRRGQGDNRHIFDYGSQPTGDDLSLNGSAHVHGLDGSNDDPSSELEKASDNSELGATGQADKKGKGKKSPPPIYFGPRNFNPASDVSQEAMQFIDNVAAAVAPTIVTTLSTIHANIASKYPPVRGFSGMGVDFFAAKIAEREDQVDEYLQYRLGGTPLKYYGVTKKIIANIPQGPHTRMYDPRPPPPPLTEEQKLIERVMKPDLRTVLPGRLIKHNYVEAAFEPSPEFVGRLQEAINSKAKTGLAAKGQDPLLLFEREKEFMGKKLGIGEGGEVCLFKVLEEDYDWYRQQGQFQVAYLDWKCKTCNSRHAIYVMEKILE